MNIIVSGCLLGINCKYNGKNNRTPDVIKLGEKYNLIPVCPEQLGGAPTPRLCHEIFEGRVINSKGADCTHVFEKGAQEVLKIAKENNVEVAVLKANSPSCGYGFVYDGTFSGRLTRGNGMCAQTLEKNGIKILNEKNFKNIL